MTEPLPPPGRNKLPVKSQGTSRNEVATQTPRGKGLSLMRSFVNSPPAMPGQKKLTPAAIIYALACGAFFIIAIFYIIFGPIFSGLLMIFPACVLGGLSYKHLQ